jgi:hypothetical protein
MMTFTKDTPAPEKTLTFDEPLFSLPQQERKVPMDTETSKHAPPAPSPKPEHTGYAYPEQSFAPAPPVPPVGIFAPNTVSQVPPMPAFLQELVSSVSQPQAMGAHESVNNVYTGTIQANPVSGQAPSNGAPSPSPAPSSNQLQVLRELQEVASDRFSLEETGSKDELANILEGFAHVLRSGKSDVFADIQYKDRSAEIMQLKELLLEAQETIIGLLNDRVFDRAKLAKLESETRLMPDLQAQATRAMGLAMRSEEVQRELSQVRNDVERLRTSYVRQEQEKSGFINWLFGKKS